jgi:hypothetical protein
LARKRQSRIISPKRTDNSGHNSNPLPASLYSPVNVFPSSFILLFYTLEKKKMKKTFLSYSTQGSDSADERKIKREEVGGRAWAKEVKGEEGIVQIFPLLFPQLIGGLCPSKSGSERRHICACQEHFLGVGGCARKKGVKSVWVL